MSASPLRPRLTLALALLATVIAAILMTRLRPGGTIERLLDPADPAVRAMDRIVARFPVAQELLVLGTLPPGREDPAELLAFAHRFSESLTTDEDARSLFTAAEYRPSPEFRRYIERVVVPDGLLFLSDSGFNDALARLTSDGMRAQLRRGRELLAAPGPAAGEMGKALLRDPLRLHELLLVNAARLAPAGVSMSPTAAPAEEGFFSGDRRSLLIRVRASGPSSDLAFAARVAAALDRLTAAANTTGLELRLSGAHLVAAHNAAQIRRDSIEGVIFTVVGIAAVIWFFQRRPVRVFLLTFTPIALGIAWGFGVYAAFSSVITPLAAVVGGALAGIGLDYCVYTLAHLRDRSGCTDPAFIPARRRRIIGPLSAAFVTSVIGFVTVGLSPVHLLRDFAVVGTLGLLGAFVAALWVLPAAAALFDSATPARQGPDWRARLLSRLRRLLARRALPLAIMSGVVAAAMAAFIAFSPWPAPDTDLQVLHPQPNPPLRAQREISATMGVAPGTVQLLLSAESDDALLRLSHEVDRRLTDGRARAAGVQGSLGLSSLLPDPAVAEQRRARLAADPSLPDRTAAEILTALTDTGFATRRFESYAGFLRRFTTPGPAPTVGTLQAYPDIARLVLPAAPAPGALHSPEAMQNVFFDNPLTRRAQRDAAIAALSATLGDLPGVTVTGSAPIGHGAEKAIYRDLPWIVSIAFAVIALYHVLHFRSLRVAAVALTPTLFSVIALAFYMTAFDQPLNLVNMVMIPLLLGIDIDYGILTASVWARAKSREEVLRAFPTTALAVLTCAASTLVGFGSLALTSIPAVQSLGWMILIGVGACAAATLLILWPLMFYLHPAARFTASSR